LLDPMSAQSLGGRATGSLNVAMNVGFASPQPTSSFRPERRALLSSRSGGIAATHRVLGETNLRPITDYRLPYTESQCRLPNN